MRKIPPKFSLEMFDEIVISNDTAYMVYDQNPVNKGHSLIIPYEHITSFFELNNAQIQDIYNLIKQAKTILDKQYNPDAYNIGINDGVVAGRTIHHLHIHIIPRYKGDCSNPIGGIRNVFPEKADYTKDL